MTNDITILVNSCDSYEDIWDPFFKLFSIYWPNCQYRIVLNTESKRYESEILNVDCLQLYKPNKKINYGKRIIEHIRHISSKYILILMDDFFLQENVDENEILKCKEWMDNNPNIAYFSFAPIKDENNEISLKYLGYEKRPQVGVYKINFQAALWRKVDLLNSWKAHESPWEYEKYATFRSFFSEKEFYCRQANTHNPINYGARYGEAWNIVSGLWVVDSVDENFKKNGITTQYENRGVLKCDIKDLPRDNSHITLEDIYHNIKSIGFYWFIYGNIWRAFRKIKMILGKNVESDYYEYLSKLLE